eukprot:scaffold4768_cov412-Prasinococcus_capsulatus_cf.AAC.21
MSTTASGPLSKCSPLVLSLSASKSSPGKASRSTENPSPLRGLVGPSPLPPCESEPASCSPASRANSEGAPVGPFSSGASSSESLRSTTDFASLSLPDTPVVTGAETLAAEALSPSPSGLASGVPSGGSDDVLRAASERGVAVQRRSQLISWADLSSNESPATPHQS